MINRWIGSATPAVNIRKPWSSPRRSRWWSPKWPGPLAVAVDRELPMGWMIFGYGSIPRNTIVLSRSIHEIPSAPAILMLRWSRSQMPSECGGRKEGGKPHMYIYIYNMCIFDTHTEIYIYIHIVDVSVGPTATSFGGIACSLYFIAVSLSSGRPDVVLQRENQAQDIAFDHETAVDMRNPRKVRISPANSAGFTYRKILVPVRFQFHWRRRSQCLVFCRTNVDCPELPGVPAVGRSEFYTGIEKWLNQCDKAKATQDVAR